MKALTLVRENQLGRRAHKPRNVTPSTRQIANVFTFVPSMVRPPIPSQLSPHCNCDTMQTCAEKWNQHNKGRDFGPVVLPQGTVTIMALQGLDPRRR
jgi:hypothetical protein